VTNNTVVSLHDGLVTVSPDFPDSLTTVLRYWARTLERSDETMQIVSKGRYENLFETSVSVDGDGRVTKTLTTLYGLAHRVFTELDAAGGVYEVIDKRTPMPPPDIEAAISILRDYQVEPVVKMLLSGGGIGACPTGWGKTYLMAALAKAFPLATLQGRGTPMTVVAAPDKDIVMKNYNDFCKILPDRDVGVIMSGAKKWSDDIMVVTLGSLHNIPAGDVGVLILDEIHSAASHKRSMVISSFTRAVTWGVSATPTGRFDGRDLVTQGLAGPCIVEIPYEEGVKCGALVPITAYILECPEPAIGLDKYLKYKSRDGQYRHGVRKNDVQSELVASIFARGPENMQMLAIVQFIEQMNNIAGYAPQAEQVHGESDELKLAGVFNVHAVSAKARKALYAKMESGEIKRAISTHVYKQGVNFPELTVIINAGGGGSDIVVKQLVGRASRKTPTKERAYVIDFSHEWDRHLKKDKKTGRAKMEDGPILKDDKSREKAYRSLGFEVIKIRTVDELPFINGRR
jgi:superfamily II DNA or RNA helicase